MKPLPCPILVIFFNRPDIFYRQLAALRSFQPPIIFFAADGARNFDEEDVEKLRFCKQMISQLVDWDCTLDFFYAKKNLGCDLFVPTAINWFFSKNQSGIILEDDCLISREFYEYSSYLLHKYRDDHRIMNISAANFQTKKWGDGDYYFSRYPANWGWATWSRAWKHFDQELNDLDRFVASGGGFYKIKLSAQERTYWLKFFKGLRRGVYTFWDAKWLYAIWRVDGLSLSPNVNLSTNIGYGEQATHTKNRMDTHALPIHSLGSTVIDPSCRSIQAEADYYLYDNFYKPTIGGLIKSAINKLRKFLL
ncbi:glycosyltransferase family 2 protein [Polynucleobacter sp. AP-Capit-er-40B-B4]|uniref:hypothetical protein n=1 Tax=Polynucleobacter sp. AP-Capit-er-40B-B4 TaxID=2576927 RepID=UPI001C0AEC10|nr:hypothetical protein [Polynucleobacter sp. AP-Capit-er-40B-B4]MBU3580978.1 glycosyltransferase family 2 protein [Polynucleobacter sp. AP-Capit-er-40B-B4]